MRSSLRSGRLPIISQEFANHLSCYLSTGKFRPAGWVQIAVTGGSYVRQAARSNHGRRSMVIEDAEPQSSTTGLRSFGGKSETSNGVVFCRTGFRAYERATTEHRRRVTVKREGAFQRQFGHPPNIEVIKLGNLLSFVLIREQWALRNGERVSNHVMRPLDRGWTAQSRHDDLPHRTTSHKGGE